MNKGIMIKVFLVLIMVSLLGGCAVLDKEKTYSEQISSEQGSTSTDVAAKNSEIEEITDKASVIKKEQEELDAALKSTLKGKEIVFNEQVYFESNEKMLYCAGGSGKTISDLKLLKETYPDLQITAHVLDYELYEAELYMNDSLKYRKVENVPDGKNIGEVYTAKLKKEFITAGSFNYKNGEVKIEVSFCLNEIGADMISKRLKVLQEIKDLYGTYTDENNEFILSWADDKYTFFIKAESQKVLDDLIKNDIYNSFTI